MPTIIDELVLKFGLDNSQFIKNAKNTNDQMVKAKAEAKKTATDLEAYGKRGAQFFGQMQRAAVEFFGVLAGATGLTQLITGVIQLESHLGKLSDQTGQSTQDLHAWGNIADLVGGKADDMQAGMLAMSQSMVNLKYRGEMSPMLLLFTQLGVRLADANGQMRNQTDIMMDLASRAERMNKQDFFGLAQSAGMSESMAMVLVKGRAELERYFAAQQKNNLVSQEQADKARKVQAELKALKQEFDNLKIEIVDKALPYLQMFLDAMDRGFKWLQANQEAVKAVFVGIGTAMALYFVPPMIAAVIALAPLILLIGLLSGVLVTLWQDYQVWKRGGKSIIDWPAWSKELSAATKAVGDLGQAILNLLSSTNGKSSFGSFFRGLSAEIMQGLREVTILTTNLADALHYIKQGEYLKALRSLASTDSRENIAAGVNDKSKISWTYGLYDSFARMHEARKKAEGAEYDGANQGATGGSQKPIGSPKYAPYASKGGESDRLKALERQYGLPAGWLDSIWMQESSRGKNMGPSSAGAEGHFQFIPSTAKAYGLKNPYDFNESADAAGRYFRDLMRQYNGNVDMVLAAYNWGSGNLQKKGLRNAPFETRNYIQNFKARMGMGSGQYLAANASAQASLAKPQATGGNVTTVENNIGSLIVQTQATDAAGIARGIPLALQQSLSGASYVVDTGVQ